MTSPVLTDRKYVSRYGGATFGINVFRNGAPGDADASEVTAALLADGATVPLWTRDATRTAEGVYAVNLTSADTMLPGPYSLRFDYTVDGSPEVYVADLLVGPSAPEYDALPFGWKGVIESVWARFGDLFDSALGGPHLQVYMQSHFGRNRLAQLLRPAIGRLTSAAQPHATYAINAEFPFDQWGLLAEQSLYIEVIKHLIRSYTEQPEAILGTAVSRLDRRDYMQRWREVLDMEMAEFSRDLSRFRMANMGLGNVSVLVAGGAFGNMGPTVNPGGAGEAAARGYYFVGRYH